MRPPRAGYQNQVTSSSLTSRRPPIGLPADQRRLWRRAGWAFADSDSPYEVDLVDWSEIADRWRQTIAAERATSSEAAP